VTNLCPRPAGPSPVCAYRHITLQSLFISDGASDTTGRPFMNSIPTTEHVLLHYGIALGLGLLIGAERERRKGVGQTRSPAGIRTFAICSLMGAVSLNLGGPVLLATVLVSVAALLVMSYRLTQESDPGLTTEAVLLLTLLLGSLAMREPTLASGLAVMVTILLTIRAPLHRFVSTILSETELNDALIFGAAALVVLPLAPDQYLGPFDALNPRTIWKIVLLILSISAIGYILLRVIGPRFGLPIAGLVSGFVSSAATIGAMGTRAAQEPSLVGAAVAGAVLSTVATVLQMAVVLQATSQSLLTALWVSLVCAGVTATVYGVIFTLKSIRQQVPNAPEVGTPFSIQTALVFAATLAAVMLFAAALQQWMGTTGVIAAAAMGGFVDTHSAAVSVASLVAAGKLTTDEAVLPVLAGLTTNTVTKIVVAVFAGDRRFVGAIIPGLLLVILAAWIGASFAL